MKTNPFSSIALAVTTALVLAHFTSSRCTLHNVFRTDRHSWSASTPHPDNTTNPPHLAPPNPPLSTCSTNTSAIFDSFGKPCLKISTIVGNQLIYSLQTDQVSYLYCGIPKNGCTYHVGIMHRLMGFPYEGGYQVHNKVNKQRIRPGPELNHMLLSNIRRYAVVRNPMKRVLSAYLNKVENFYKDDALKTPDTFRQWVYKELKPGMTWEKVNKHWKAQVEYCGFKIRDLSSYFTLFRVENPDEYLEYMEQFLPEWVLRDGWEMPNNKSFREYVLGPRSRTENTTERFYDYMGNTHTFDYLRKVYSEDIMSFGYETEVDELRRQLVRIVGEKR